MTQPTREYMTRLLLEAVHKYDFDKARKILAIIKPKEEIRC